jgi:hypothetical protein
MKGSYKGDRVREHRLLWSMELMSWIPREEKLDMWQSDRMFIKECPWVNICGGRSRKQMGEKLYFHVHLVASVHLPRDSEASMPHQNHGA